MTYEQQLISKLEKLKLEGLLYYHITPEDGWNDLSLEERSKAILEDLHVEGSPVTECSKCLLLATKKSCDCDAELMSL